MDPNNAVKLPRLLTCFGYAWAIHTPQYDTRYGYFMAARRKNFIRFGRLDQFFDGKFWWLN